MSYDTIAIYVVFTLLLTWYFTGIVSTLDDYVCIGEKYMQVLYHFLGDREHRFDTDRILEAVSEDAEGQLYWISNWIRWPSVMVCVNAQGLGFLGQEGWCRVSVIKLHM